MEDSTIIELYWARSQEAIRATDGKYGAYCTSIAHNILNNREDAEECVSDTYLNVWNAIPPQRPARFAAFLGRITRNLSINRYHARHAQRRGGGEVPLLLEELESCLPAPGGVEQELEAQWVLETINRFLATLDSGPRMVFVRRYWYADSVADIAKRFSMSENRVKSMLFRTRGRLRVHLEKEGVRI